jgi:tetratricopeptide (TPR) repeat protein
MSYILFSRSRSRPFIDAAIIRSASDRSTLLALYLLKCTALFGQLLMVMDDLITENSSRVLTPQVMQSESVLTRKESAFGAIADALTIDPRCYLAYYLKGTIFLATLDFRNALRAFDAALALEPDDSTRLSIYAYKAGIYAMRTPWSDTNFCDPEKAIECCEKILQIDPTDETASILLEALRGCRSEAQ